MGHRLGRCSAPKRRKTRGTTKDDGRPVRVQNFTRLFFSFFPYGCVRVLRAPRCALLPLLLLSGRGEMITTPNRLRGEREDPGRARVYPRDRSVLRA